MQHAEGEILDIEIVQNSSPEGPPPEDGRAQAEASVVARVIISIMLIACVLGGGAAGTWWYLTHIRKAKRDDIPPRPELVEVIDAKASRQKVLVRAMGNVVPAVQIDLRPEVSGRIIKQNSELIRGGRFKAGETILEIDPRDYQFAVEQQKANLERAKLALKVEEGRRTIAEQEWKLLKSDISATTEGRQLALRQPHMKSAQAALNAAQSSLEKAALDLERTTIKAPFNALVLNESVDVGQLVTPQTQLASLVGTDAYYVQVVVPVGRLGWMKIPGVNGDEGAPAKVVHSIGDGVRVERNGRVVRLLGDISRAGRMARLLVQIDDPLGLREGATGMPLLLGAFVRVDIDGKELDGVFELPRKAIREGDRVWILGDDGRLDIRKVKILWRREQTVLLADSIRDGDRIIISRIATPMPGMKLRTEADTKKLVEQPFQAAD